MVSSPVPAHPADPESEAASRAGLAYLPLVKEYPHWDAGGSDADVLAGGGRCDPAGDLDGADCNGRKLPPGAAQAPGGPQQRLDPLVAVLGIEARTAAPSLVPPRIELSEWVWGVMGMPGSPEAVSAVGEPSGAEPSAAVRPDASVTLPLPAAPASAPLAGLLPIDVEALRRSADAFFARLADLARDGEIGPWAVKVIPWVGAVSVVAYEWARLRKEKTLSGLSRADGGFPGIAFFPEGEGV